jgi:hypothetical protein
VRSKKRRKELCDRAIGSEVRRRGARHKRDKVNVVEMNNEQNIFVTKMRGDEEPSPQDGCWCEGAQT